MMFPHSAQYLLRFDDLCPSMSRQGWRRFLALIEEFQLRPILAIVPDNHDPGLEIAPPDPEFWSQMRAFQSAGATIGLHGYRHLCVNRGRSLVPLRDESEFAGVGEETQRLWIREGLRILRSHGLNPRIWIAPRHGFDRATLRALRAEGIELLSDGFARAPFVRGGVTWLPMQIWAPVEKAGGLWTICVHPNTAPSMRVEQLRAFLQTHASQFTSVERVLSEFPAVPLSLVGKLASDAAVRRLKAIDKAKRSVRRVLQLRRSA